MGVGSGGEGGLMVGQGVSENYFELLGVRPERGRAFTAEEGAKPGAHPVAVVSHHFWQQRLGGARRREIAIRLSRGARRGRLVRPLLPRRLLLAPLAAGLGRLPR